MKITYDDFAKVEIKVGKILSAEKIPETDKLLKLSVDFGQITETLATIAPVGETADKAELRPDKPIAEIQMTEMRRDVRQIVSGISMYFPDPSVLVGKRCMFVTNLEPRKIKGFESNGMLFAVSTPDGKFSLLEPQGDIPEGTKAK
jgi:methionyl-tRNA synthetase